MLSEATETQSHGGRRFLFALCVSVTLWLVLAFAQEKATRTVWDSVYTVAQAERGARLFAEQCASCHGAEMKGGPGVPGLVGAEFMFTWNDQTAGALFELMQTTMPLDAPGALTRPQYVDVIAAVFQGNGFPAHAERELSAERAALDDVLIVRKQ